MPPGAKRRTPAASRRTRIASPRLVPNSVGIVRSVRKRRWTIYTTNGMSPEKFGFGRPAKPAGVIRNGRVVRFGPEFRAGLWAYLIGEHRNSGAHAYGWHSDLRDDEIATARSEQCIAAAR
jgi:hypothetical protein